jgi:hypothetical protein
MPTQVVIQVYGFNEVPQYVYLMHGKVFFTDYIEDATVFDSLKEAREVSIADSMEQDSHYTVTYCLPVADSEHLFPVPAQEDYDEWYDSANNQTLDSLRHFVRHVSMDYEHTYDSFVNACSAAALATISIINHIRHGHVVSLTYGDAGDALWLVISRMVDRPKLGFHLPEPHSPLNPRFTPVLSEETWKRIQTVAKTWLEDGYVPAEYVECVKLIAAGGIPTGWSVEE